MGPVLGALLTFGLTSALCPVVVPVLARAGRLDVPNERSSHTVAVVRGLGIAPALAGLVGLVVVAGSSLPLSVLGVPLAYALLGLTDDIRSRSPRVRLAVQVLLAPAAGLAVARPHEALPIAFVALAGMATVGFVNAYNFMDGIDGIALAQVLVAGGTWALIAARADDHVFLAVAAVTAAGAAGALPWNAPPARAFLGDVGSYYFGALLSVVAAFGIARGLGPIAVLAPLALFTADTASTMVGHVVERTPVLRPHRDHAYQRLARTLLGSRGSLAVATTVMTACGAAGVVSFGSSGRAEVLLGAAVLMGCCGFVLLPRFVAADRGPAGSAG